MTPGLFECKENNSACVKEMMSGWFLATVCCMATICEYGPINTSHARQKELDCDLKWSIITFTVHIGEFASRQ